MVDEDIARTARPSGFPPLDPSAIYRQMDLDHLVRAYSDLHPEAAFMALFNAYVAEGSTPQNVGIMETSVDSRQVVLTANSETIYAVHPVNLADQGGAVVVEVPPRMMGMANSPGWVNITDIGGLGPDQGRGGTYVFTAPDFDGAVPADCFHFSAPTNTIVWLLRGFVDNGDTAATVRFMQEHIRTYPLAATDDPPKTTFYNTSESQTLGHPMNMLYEREDVFGLIRQFFDMNGPAYPTHRHIHSHLVDMGFFDGTVDTALLDEAAAIGDIRQRTLTFNNRAPDAVKWPGKSGWKWANNYADELFTGRHSGLYTASQHQVWAHQATFNSIGMTRPPKGAGSQYIMAAKDSDGRWLDGGKRYTLTLPPDPPAKDFWSVIAYDATNRSMVQNDEFRWGVNSYAGDLGVEQDGSVRLHFCPTQPDGTNRRNWIQTNVGQGYFVWFRTYGPTDAWYDDSWILPDIKFEAS
ncbi:DUF1214 domain-containing protein [Mycobacterium syngnathidarum]